LLLIENTDEDIIAYCSDSFSSDDFTSDDENDENSNEHQVTDALLQNTIQKPDKKKKKKKLLYVNKLFNLDLKKVGGKFPFYEHRYYLPYCR
jgi:hypothetical protein